MSKNAGAGRPVESDADILVPVSVGELVDKITILQIKAERIGNRDQVANVRRELAALQAVATRITCDAAVLAQCTADLKRVNEALWEIEDAIRDCEARGDFGARFVTLARSIYRHNDERARLKRTLNIAAGSRYVEEKSYAAFAPSRDSD
jgi:hypothetical protein